VRLAGATLLLVRGPYAYVNGEELRPPADARPLVARLADRRALAPETDFTPGAEALLYTWYRSGYLLPSHE
jgi:hypothetical protein